MNIYLIEEYIYLSEDVNILFHENLISSFQNKLASMSMVDMKNKLLSNKDKAIDKLKRNGFNQQTIDKIINKIVNKYKNKIKIEKLSDANMNNAKKFIKSIGNDIKKELSQYDIKNRFSEGKLILSVIALFIIAFMGTLLLIITIKGILLIPLFWFFILVTYQLITQKYINEYEYDL